MQLLRHFDFSGAVDAPFHMFVFLPLLITVETLLHSSIDLSSLIGVRYLIYESVSMFDNNMIYILDVTGVYVSVIFGAS